MSIHMMMFIALSGAAPNAPSTPAASTVDRDLRCVTAASVLQQLNELRGDDADRRASLLAFTLYYIGKVKGAQPNIELASAIRKSGPLPEEPEARDDIVVSCLEEFRQVGGQLKNAGKTLQNNGEQ